MEGASPVTMRFPQLGYGRSSVFVVLLTSTLCLAAFDAWAAPTVSADPKKKAAGKSNKAATKTASKTNAKATPKGSSKKPLVRTVANKTSTVRRTTATNYRTVARRPIRYAPMFSAEEREAALSWINENMTPQQETFENVRALVPFFEMLFQSARNKTPVHVLHYGDSHTASDDFPNSLREQFQSRFGNGGPGFSLAGRPFRGYRRYDVPNTNSTDAWTTEGNLTRRGDGMHGLGGVSITSKHPGDTVNLTAAGEQSELLFLQQPTGGDLEVWVDDNLLGTVSTQGDLRPATAPLIETPGEHRYTFKTLNSNPVRLFGTVVQNKSGVTWEAMGINGAQATMLADWDESILEAHLAKRNPALIVLAYGTNEANNPNFDSKEYSLGLRKVLSRLRKGAPMASILLVGPPDCRIRNQQNLDLVIEAQINVAHQMGAAFWHWRDHMGGANSIGTWVACGLAQGDYIHMTTAGYQLLGRTLAEELLIQYQRFVNARMETE